MSGDWVQLHEGKDFLVIAIGDSVGKGTSAALLTGVIAAFWNSHRARWRTVADVNLTELLHALDATIQATFRGEQTTTVSLVLLTPIEATFLSLASPLWLGLSDVSARVRAIRTPAGNPLGMPGMEAESVRTFVPMKVEAAARQMFLAYTDGVIDGYEGEARLRRMLRQSEIDFNSAKVFDQIEDITIRAGQVDGLEDDATLVLIQREGIALEAAA
jgi:serine phosphatase RsbU (regulator of sigma subunit)